MGVLDECVSRAEKRAIDEKVRKRVGLVRASLDYAKVCAEYLRTLDRVQKEGGLPWAHEAVIERASKLSRPYVTKIREALMNGRRIKATSGPNDPYIQRLLDPARVLRSWNEPDYGFPLTADPMQKSDWKEARGLSGGNEKLPSKVSIWVVGYDFDASTGKSECNLWTIGPEGRKIMIGGLAPKGDPGNKRDRCYVFPGLEISNLTREGKNGLLFITNPNGGWVDAALYAVYVMPGDTRLTSDEAMNGIVKDLDSVRERAMGFIEFQGSGLIITDGQTTRLPIEIFR